MTEMVILGISIPFIGTLLGSSLVLFFKNGIKMLYQKMLIGFASGVMIAASIWSLLIPAIDMVEAKGGIGWLPAGAGFLLGMFFLLLLDSVIPHLHRNTNISEGPSVKMKKNTMMLFAVTLHNIPEGMAIGVVFAGLLEGNGTIMLAGALVLSVGIALQNFPEGAIVSMPLKANGVSRGKAFFLGTMSGIVEPIAAGITILLTHLMVPILPYLLAFAAGAMIYVVVEELIPELQEGTHSNIGIIGVAFGFALMMILDVALG